MLNTKTFSLYHHVIGKRYVPTQIQTTFLKLPISSRVANSLTTKVRLVIRTQREWVQLWRLNCLPRAVSLGKARSATACSLAFNDIPMNTWILRRASSILSTFEKIVVAGGGKISVIFNSSNYFHGVEIW